MKRLIAKKPYRSGTGDYMKAWARNIQTSTMVEVDLLNQYDDHRTEVGYMNNKFIVENEDLLTPEQYNEYIEVAKSKGLTDQDAINAMVSKVSIEEWKNQ